ncbi:PI-PLC X domain-containing protein 3 [Chelonia mydas]|uniref:PI-PLC X domain-containing protein 3 n=1 Tax=Chelonia mydas TaxID=8469 RepID=M7B427_CHEMY|nr:PI-PLC X domain-containing protein 3 [Chelonia mydas]
MAGEWRTAAIGSGSCKWLYLWTVRALPAMMHWVRTQKPGESGINIITADFVELGDFISTVIKLNYILDEGEADTT